MTIAGALAPSRNSTLLPSAYYTSNHSSSKPAWHHTPTVRRQLFQGLALLSGVSLVRAGYVGYTQSVKNISFYSLLGVAALSFIAALRCLPFSKNTDDYAVAKQLRQRAIQEIESSPDLKFSEFLRKYKGLLDRSILEPSDAKGLLERDVMQLDYVPFMDKHAGGDLVRKEKIIEILSHECQERLRAKCRLAFATDSSKTKDGADEKLLKDVRNPNQAALLAKDWDSFIRSNSVRNVKDPQALEALKILFLEKAYKGDTDHFNEIYQFSEEAQQFIRATLSRIEFGLFLEGKMAFNDMRWSRGWENIKVCLEQTDPSQQEDAKQKLRQGYLSHLSYEELSSEERKEMRAALGITSEMMESMQGSVRSDAEKLSYLGDNGFRRKYGNSPLKKKTLLPEHVDKIKAELRKELPTSSSFFSYEIWEDLKLMGIYDEIFRERFEKIEFARLWKEERYSFFTDEGLKILGLEAIKSKLIREWAGLSIFQILKNYQDLFSKYLQSSDILREGKTFAECAEIEVAHAGDLFKEVIPYDVFNSNRYLIQFLPILFAKGLLLPSSPALRKLLRSFLQANSKEILEYSGGDRRYATVAIDSWRKIQAIPEIFTPQVKGAYEAGCAAIVTAREELKKAKEEIGKRSYEPSPERKQLEQKLSAERKQLGEAQEQERKMRSESYTFSSSLPAKASQLQDHKQRIYAQYSALEGLPQLQRKLQSQIAELEKAAAPDPSSLIQLSQRLSEMRSSLQKQEQAYEQELEKLPEVQAKIQAIAEARKAMDENSTDWFKKKNAWEELQRQLKVHIAYSCPVPEPLAKARQELGQCEEQQERLLQSLEVQSQKPQALAELRKKEQAIASQMEKYRKDIPVLESELPALQAAYDKEQEENKARIAKEKDLRRQIQELDASVKTLEAKASKDPDREKFNSEVSRATQAVDEKYKAELQKQITAFINKVAPEEAAAV
ncbi:MAG: hypothetical protein JSS10_03195 [Verrucomicrobia bacterium]|nr:hypothetical protein [Verrucomicrobiota bacterium]